VTGWEVPDNGGACVGFYAGDGAYTDYVVLAANAGRIEIRVPSGAQRGASFMDEGQPQWHQVAGADYSLLSECLGDKKILTAYEISVTPDDAFGLPLTVGFLVDEKYNGRAILILHKLHSGTVEQFTPSVSGGLAYVTVTELSPFMLAVEPDVLITVQPEDAMVLAGQTATFKVEAKGLGLACKWQRRTGPTDSWKDIPGATSTSYTTTKVNKSHNGYQYRVIISDGYGNSVTSGIATLYISVSPDTGDRQNPVLYACLAILSTAVGLWLIKKRRAA
jgi:hypothetical protein